MKIRPSARAKAVFLTTIFLLNTMVGFACSVGMDMGFNKGHRDQGHNIAESSGHSHPEGTKEHTHGRSNTKAVHHDHKTKGNSAAKDYCFKDEVAKFVDVYKQLTKNIDIRIPLLFPVAIVPAFLSLANNGTDSQSPDNSHFVRQHHPSIRDICTVIQCFQI